MAGNIECTGLLMAGDHSAVLAEEGPDVPVAAAATAGYRASDPAVRDHAIVDDDISGKAELPKGWAADRSADRLSGHTSSAFIASVALALQRAPEGFRTGA